MPHVIFITVALVLLGVTVIYLIFKVRRLEKRQARAALDEAESDARIRELFGVKPKRPGGRHRGNGPHLWLVSGVAAIAGSIGAWVKAHPTPAASAAAALAAIAALLFAGAGSGSGGERAMPEPIAPPTFVPSSPSLTTEPPTTGPPSTTPSARAGARTAQPVRKPVTTSLPPATVTTTVPSTTATLTTTEPPTVPPTATTSRPCLLRVQMTTLADLCVAA